jgi:hypothetical protein
VNIEVAPMAEDKLNSNIKTDNACGGIDINNNQSNSKFNY